MLNHCLCLDGYRYSINEINDQTLRDEIFKTECSIQYDQVKKKSQNASVASFDQSQKEKQKDFCCSDFPNSTPLNLLIISKLDLDLFLFSRRFQSCLLSLAFTKIYIKSKTFYYKQRPQKLNEKLILLIGKNKIQYIYAVCMQLVVVCKLKYILDLKWIGSIYRYCFI